MNKLEYIPGDFITWLGHKFRIDGVIVDPDTKRIDYYEIADTGSRSVFQGDSLKPIKLTYTILKKNGWKKDGKWYYLPTKRAYLYITRDAGQPDEFLICVGDGKYNLTSVSFVHQLQHLFFGLGINHEMEV